MEITRGQKLKLPDASIGGVFDVIIDASAPGMTIDKSCFGIDADGRLSDDRYFIFYNQKASPCSSLSLADGAFKVNLSTLPPTIKRLVFVITIDGVGTMSALGQSSFRLVEAGVEKVMFPFSGSDFASEKAVMVAEVYFKDTWRLAAVGQGFTGGLSALLKHFGGQETTQVVPPPAPPVPPAPPAPTAAPKVNLSKVTLEKRGDSRKISLAKKSSSVPIHINLQWDEPNKGGEPAAKAGGFLSGLFSQKSSAVDLDLGCMYRLKSGDMGVIQPLGGYFGADSESPWIRLDKDDRTGAAADGENMYVHRPETIDLMVVFALIYSGTARFSSVNGRVSIKDGETETEIRLNNPDDGKRLCAVARIHSDGGDIRIVKDELYFTDHKACDEHYGFGFRWVAGKK